ncbi:hypothetical protein BKA70DRAFT_1349985, partial [Coprinopsis sp. MPI-PUGE-AT-0042]
MDPDSQHREATTSGSNALIRNVPAEIWAKVIHWGIGGPGVFVDEVGRKEFLRLRQVSTQWRRSAFSTPHLWRYLSIDTDKGFGEDPHCAMLALKKLIPQWFERAGRGAEVHLELGGWMVGDDSHVYWVDVVWGLEERPYRLVTARLWGDLILGPDICLHRPGMSDLKTLSLGHAELWGSNEYPSVIDVAFPHLEDLAFRGTDELLPLAYPIRHPNLRSLLLSHLIFLPQQFMTVLEALPLLEELIIHNCRFMRRGSSTLQVNNSSIQTLICAPMILSSWPKVVLSSIKLLKLIPNKPSSFRYASRMGGESQSAVSDNVDLVWSGGAVACWAPKVLIIDLTLLDVEPHGIIPFLSNAPSFLSLRLKRLAPLLSDDDGARSWRGHPNVKEVICQEDSAFPPSFVVTPSLAGENMSSLSIFLPNDSGEREDEYYRCVELAARDVQLSLVRLHKQKINALLDDSICIRNHEYERIKGGFRKQL